MVLNDLSSWWSKFKFGTYNKNLDGDCRCKSTSNCNSCCNDMFLFCLCSKVGFQTCQLALWLVKSWLTAPSSQYKSENPSKSFYCWNYIWNIFNEWNKWRKISCIATEFAHLSSCELDRSWLLHFRAIHTDKMTVQINRLFKFRFGFFIRKMKVDKLFHVR